MAEFEIDKYLLFVLGPFYHRRGLYSLHFVHQDVLQYFLISIHFGIDYSGQFVAVMSLVFILLLKTLKR